LAAWSPPTISRPTKAGLDLGLVAAFRAKSSKGLDAMGFTLVLGVEGFGN
jgi:hypothetical protein